MRKGFRDMPKVWRTDDIQDNKSRYRSRQRQSDCDSGGIRLIHLPPNLPVPVPDVSVPFTNTSVPVPVTNKSVPTTSTPSVLDSKRTAAFSAKQPLSQVTETQRISNVNNGKVLTPRRVKFSETTNMTLPQDGKKGESQNRSFTDPHKTLNHRDLANPWRDINTIQLSKPGQTTYPGRCSIRTQYNNQFNSKDPDRTYLPSVQQKDRSPRQHDSRERLRRMMDDIDLV